MKILRGNLKQLVSRHINCAILYYHLGGNISSNSEAPASELLENLEEMFT